MSEVNQPGSGINPRDLTTARKALLINLDQDVYGTFAEIGAGQEVARHFFKVGGAAGTIAKSMSAYDMKFSDEIYGKASRYVSRDRLRQMMDHEYNLLTQRLAAERGDKTTFFVFADTVAAAGYRQKKDCHGWMGLRYQLTPGSEPNDIIMHVRMLDNSGIAQQDALGVVGVNFIWAALMYFKDTTQFINSLLDQLDASRIEVDMLQFEGPEFAAIDNRLISLALVEHGLTNAVMFGPGNSVLQPSEVLYKKAILLERGSFRPITHVNVDILNSAGAQFLQETGTRGEDVLALFEISLRNLLDKSSTLDHEDMLARIDTICALGYNVLISDYREYFRLSAYFRRYTDRMLGIVLGINHLQAIFKEAYYAHLDGGILEAFGRLFKEEVKVYVYPIRGSAFHDFIDSDGDAPSAAVSAKGSDSIRQMLVTAQNLKVDKNLRHLYAHLLENGFIEPISGINLDHLDLSSKEVFEIMQSGESGWESAVPAAAVKVIRERGLWGVSP